MSVPFITHNDGTKIQSIGIGTYRASGAQCEQAIREAIDVGYRHVDTAFFYRNEQQVGKAIRDKIAEGVIKREDIYVVTKLWGHHHSPTRVEHGCRKSLENLGLDYVDLYLMHFPQAYAYHGDDVLIPKKPNGGVEIVDIDYLDTWKAMENLVEKGLVKSIGVSNFNYDKLQRLLANCKIKPIHNQVECNPAVGQQKLLKLCKEQNIVLCAYRPLGSPDPLKKKPKFMFDSKVRAIADNYKKSPAQVVLRYLIEIGTIPIPKSINKDRIKENFNVFDFHLSVADHKVLNSFRVEDRNA